MLLLVVNFAGLILVGCSKPERVVTLYTSQDEDFAEPILKRFTKETGIAVQTVFDSEAVKTVGLANRLLSETNHPQCDVWWSNEELRTRQLARRGVFQDTNGWAPFGLRSRRIVVNTKKLAPATAPSLVDLTNAQWRGKVALAYPMFGTTSAHFMALRQKWGDVAWDQWCRALAANHPFIVDGNSVVVKFVGRGDASVGLTDSDDIAAGQRESLPVAAAPLTSESLLIPNTVAMIRGAPHESEALALFRFLQSADVANSLIAVGAIEATNTSSRPHLAVNWPRVLDDMEAATLRMKEIFLR